MIATGSVLKTTIDDMHERIKITYREKTKDGRGAIILGEESTRCTVWAKVLPYGGNIGSGTAERENAVDYRIVIRYRSDISPDDLVVWRGKTLKLIKPPYDAESKRVFTVIEARELMQDAQT